MAKLAALRARLPVHLRQPHSRTGISGQWSTLQAVHSVMLFHHIASDLVVLNSAFGHPLPLGGPWQWLDGPLFMHMLDAVDHQQAVAEANSSRRILLHCASNHTFALLYLQLGIRRFSFQHAHSTFAAMM